MANLNTNIEWTDATWNFVTGCSKVSLGCKNCYAERLFPRVYGKERKFTDVKLHPERLEQPLHWKKPRMIFVNSMSDLFHEDVPEEFIWECIEAMCEAHWHTYQILTKRPQRMFDILNKSIMWWNNDTPEHIWLGVSCENQETADERIPLLLQVPAAVRFLSCEPLLDEIDFRIDGVYPGKLFGECGTENGSCSNNSCRTKMDWVVVGGESGPSYRPMNLDWARSIRDQCKNADVPFFFKQTAGKKAIPEDLQIREYPKCQKE